MNVEQRRTVGGIGILVLAALIAAYSGAAAAFLALAAGFILGWLVMFLLIRTGLAAEQPKSARYPTAAVSLGIAIAAILTGLLSALNPSAPLAFAPGPIAFVAGLILALRFSSLGKVQV